MDTDKITLPAFQIAELYKETLVDLPADFFSKKEIISPEMLTGQPASSKGMVSYLGDNGKNVLIIVNQPDEASLKEAERTFLTTILKACNLTLADIAIVNIASQPVTYSHLKEQLHPDYLLFFDAEPSAVKLPFMIPHFQIQKYDGASVVVAPALAALNEPTKEGKVLKTKLWMSLKQAFGIS